MGTTRGMLIAAAFAAALAVVPQTATAKTVVRVGVGAGCYGWGYWGYCGWSGHRHFHKRAYHWDNRRPVIVHYYGNPYPRAARFACGDARAMLRHRGYSIIRATDCNGKYFVFRAAKGGHRYLVSVNAWTGRIVSVRHI